MSKKRIAAKTQTIKTLGRWLYEEPDHKTYKAICMALANSHPSIFIRLVADATTMTDPDRDFKRRVRQIYGNRTGLIEAIKFVRAERGMGLKEAKDFVEELAATMPLLP